LTGVASLGVRPPVEDSGRILLETYVFEYDRQCYGEVVRVEFLKKLRDEEKYIDLPTLTDAIARDVDNARDFFRQRDALAVSATDRI
jgi:riboflavin kinase/FMN adenylyltransferase